MAYRQGTFRAALQSLEESVDISRALLEPTTADVATTAILGAGISRLAATLAADGDRARAQALFAESTSLLESATVHVQFFETELAEHYSRSAVAGLGRWAQAAAQWRAIRDAGRLNPLDRPKLEEAERRAVAERP